MSEKPDIITDKKQIYNGLVLFDVDGTLTTGKDNEKVVQLCLDNNWAVGICTAGSIYTMENILSFPWMPRNLYDFIRKHDNITFNNTASYILCGKFSRDAYESLNIPLTENIHGYRKGFALVTTGSILGITNPRRLILCDDMRIFIKSALYYQPSIGIVCSGQDCGGTLSVDSVSEAINKSMRNS